MTLYPWRLAWIHGNGRYQSTKYGFTTPAAAAAAARLHNPRRLARHEPPYSVIARFEGAEMVEFIELPKVTA